MARSLTSYCHVCLSAPAEKFFKTQQPNLFLKVATYVFMAKQLDAFEGCVETS